MKAFKDHEGLPTLLAHGNLTEPVARGVSHYLVIRPRGQLLGDDSDPELVCSVFQDIASVIKKLSLWGILHR